MNVLREIKEQRVPAYVSTPNGCEVFNDEGNIKIILKRTLSHIGAISQSFYISQYYIWEDNGWLKTSESKTYDSIESFIHDISIADEFSVAVNDYSASLHDNI